MLQISKTTPDELNKSKSYSSNHSNFVMITNNLI